MSESASIGSAIRVLYDLYRRASPDQASWDGLARFFKKEDGEKLVGNTLKAIPARVGSPDEARSWPGNISERNYCKIATTCVEQILRRERSDCVALAQLVRQSLVQKRGLSDAARDCLERIELSADKGDTEVMGLFDELFHGVYKEADENRKRPLPMGRSHLREQRRGGSAPGPSPHGPEGADRLTPDVLARELGGGSGGLPVVPACLGRDGTFLLERLMPRSLYLTYREELRALAASPDPVSAARIALALTEEDGAGVAEVAERARRLVAGGDVDCCALFSLEERFFTAQPEGPALTRARLAVDRFADREPARILAALFLLSLTGMSGTIVALSSRGA